MTKPDIKTIVGEEVSKMIQETTKKVRKDSNKIEKKLEELRKKFLPEMLEKESLSPLSRNLEKRVALNTVSELLDIPVNELMLYFLVEVKSKATRSLVEYRLGHVVFYAC